MALQDYYNTGHTTHVTIQTVIWSSQEFLAGSSYVLTSVKLLLFKLGTPGTITVSIRDTDVNGRPTGGDIDGATGTTDGDTLPTGSPYEWREITLSSGISITSGTKYAIVVRAASGNIYWRQDGSSPYYADGRSGQSTNSGSTWNDFIQSYMFETHSSPGVIITPHYYNKLLVGNS